MRPNPRLSFKSLVSVALISVVVLLASNCHVEPKKPEPPKTPELTEFIPPDTSDLKDDIYGRTVKYGMRLMLNTAYYIGPHGTVGKYLGNEMTCTNCHLNAGAKPYGNNLFNTHRTYPQYRAREDKILTCADRVNNCITRPHNGKPLPLDSEEMTAFVTYIQWLGKDYNPEKHFGHGIKEIDYHGLKSNPEAGAEVFKTHCQSCHMADGNGLYDSTAHKYVNPPLWGKNSYKEGSSMHRVIKSASFIYHNMPNGTNWNLPKLTVQEALDVAGFINSTELSPRVVDTGVSYPNLKTKPIDYFKGPYLDTFSVYQHTFGPWDELTGK